MTEEHTSTPQSLESRITATLKPLTAEQLKAFKSAPGITIGDTAGWLSGLDAYEFPEFLLLVTHDSIPGGFYEGTFSRTHYFTLADKRMTQFTDIGRIPFYEEVGKRYPEDGCYLTMYQEILSMPQLEEGRIIIPVECQHFRRKRGHTGWFTTELAMTEVKEYSHALAK